LRERGRGDRADCPWMCDVQVHAVTRRLARNFDGLFPDHDLQKEPHVIVTLALQTKHRQSAMSNEMLTERQERHGELVARMQAFKAHFDSEARWCDYIDPSSGEPVHASTSTNLIECDERYRSLGFEILELGCCRALCNKRFGQCLVMTSAFVQGLPEDVDPAIALLEAATEAACSPCEGPADPPKGAEPEVSEAPPLSDDVDAVGSTAAQPADPDNEEQLKGPDVGSVAETALRMTDAVFEQAVAANMPDPDVGQNKGNDEPAVSTRGETGQHPSGTAPESGAASEESSGCRIN